MKRNYSLPRSPARTTAQAFFTKRTLGFVQKQLPDRRRDTNKTTLTLTLSRPTGEGTARPVSRSFQSAWIRRPTEDDSASPIRWERAGVRVSVPPNLKLFLRESLIALLLALYSAAISLPAASPPPVTLMYTTTNNAPVHGGMATIAPFGNPYFSILSTSTNPANVKKLTTGGTVIWTFNGPGVGTNYDMYAIPALDAAGAKLYIGSDAGIFYCRKTTDGTKADGWTDFVVPGTGERRIRSGAALDPNNPLGPTVYFHCNNGYLYALDANTGAQR